MRNLSLNLAKALYKTMTLGIALFALGYFTAILCGVPAYASYIGLALALTMFIPKGTNSSALTITATDVVAEWGAVYRGADQAGKDARQALIDFFLQKSETEAIFTRHLTDKTILEKSSAEISKVLQRFQKAFTTKGGVTFKPRKIELNRLKIDVSEYPDELVPSWLSFLAENNLKRSEWPFVKWYAERLLAKSNEDWELDEIFKGKLGTITPGTATASGTNANGIKFLLNKYHTEGTINTITMGAVPVDPVQFVEYVEDFFKLIQSSNETLAENLDNLFMSKTLSRRFKTGMREKYNMNYSQADLATIIDTNVGIVGLNSHAGSTKIWTTPKENRVLAVKGAANESIFKVEENKREVAFMTDYWKGVGLWVSQFAFQNDVELV